MANLLLIPTQHELTVLQPLLDEFARRDNWSIALCGLGPIAAAARASQLIARQQTTDHVLLIGVAGTYDPRQQLGTAVVFNQVACYGIGAGTNEQHQAASELGWPQWQETDSSFEIGDQISLDVDSHQGCPNGGQLLTCCSASATSEDVQCRTRQYPNATAEDMEGFGVAMACELANVRLHIARGISNLAGDRNREDWQFDAALQAVAELASSIMFQMG